MASLIYEGTGTGQGRRDEQVSELAMRTEPSAPAGLAANQGNVSAARPASAPVVEKIYRHRLPVRISPWLNVPILIILIMSGLQIFNAHPALYWDDHSDRDQPLLSIRPMKTENGETKGITTILGPPIRYDGHPRLFEWLGSRLSCVGDGAQRQMARDGPAMASLFCLGLGDQWPVLHSLCANQPACHARSGSDQQGPAWHRQGRQRSHGLPASPR